MRLSAIEKWGKNHPFPSPWMIGGADLVAQVMKELGAEGEMTLHTDPCHRVYCRMCDLEDCVVRRDLFTGRPPLTVDEAVQPDMPRERS